MGNRNIYKDIVFFVVGCLMVAGVSRGIQFWNQEQKTYEFTIKSSSELTESVVRELEKITGLYEFTPVSECGITLKLQEYTMEAEVSGISLECYSLKWKSAEEEMKVGNTPILFFGEESFRGFVDIYGNAPGKSQISEWIRHYQELEVALFYQEKQIGKGKISGILKEPATGIYMDRKQMQKLYQNFCKTTGGCIKVQGNGNFQQAKKILMQAGFQMEETDRERDCGWDQIKAFPCFVYEIYKKSI